MGRIGIIGGSGFQSMHAMGVDRREEVETPFGAPTSPLIHGAIGGQEVVFLPRHGPGHAVPPHKINYRANMRALADAGVEGVVALGAVGGIGEAFGPGVLAVPDQIIDYTWGRESTFFDGSEGDVVHIDFTRPFCVSLSDALARAAEAAGVPVHRGGVYAVTQGPRLETVAEVTRLARDGCDMVGMTMMPEAALARELGLCYAGLAFVVNWAAGKTEGEIGMDEIEANLAECRGVVERVLVALAAKF